MPLTILNVDDSRSVRTVVRRAFESCDCEVREAANGEEGLAEAARHKPDLIVLDVAMPVMDGLTMLGCLKDDPALKMIPVLMLTGDPSRENISCFTKLGVRDFVTKPFTGQQLIEKAGWLVPLQRNGGAIETTRA
jgi:two-component system, cell cycle response regulator